MVFCSACNLNILVTQKRIKCTNGSCANNYHQDCVKYNDNQGLRAKWVCPECIAIRPKSGDNSNVPVNNKNAKTKLSPSSDSDSSSSMTFGSIEVLLNKKFTELETKLIHRLKNELLSVITSEICKEITKLQEDFTRTTDFLQLEQKDLKNKIISLEEQIKKSNARCSDISNKNMYLEKCSRALEDRVRFLEEKETEKRVEIVGIQTKNEEPLKAIVNKIANHFKLDCEEIIDVWKIGGENKNKKGRPNTIIVSLRTREARREWLNCRVQRITNAQIFNDGNNNPIYINENISKHTRNLFWQAKTNLKEIFKFLWIQNSKVLVRKEEGAKIQHIQCEADILNALK